MTDIREMSKDEITLLNKGSRRPTGVIKMTDVTNRPAPVKLKRTKTNKAQTPSYDSSTLTFASDERIAAALNATRSRSEFTRKLDELETGRGIEVQGDITRLRQKISVLAKKSNKKFIARNVDDVVVIVRVEPQE
jgi:hypothetical protein